VNYQDLGNYNSRITGAFKYKKEQRMVVHAYNSSYSEANVGRLQSMTSPGKSIRSYLKTTTKTKSRKNWGPVSSGRVLV
jgi:hypothetical protein